MVEIENHGPEEAHAVSVAVGYSQHLSYSATKVNIFLMYFTNNFAMRKLLLPRACSGLCGFM